MQNPKQIIKTDGAPSPVGPYSQAVGIGDLGSGSDLVAFAFAEIAAGSYHTVARRSDGTVVASSCGTSRIWRLVMVRSWG